MRAAFDRLMVGVGIALFALSLIAGMAKLSKGSAVANQMGMVASLAVIAVGLVDQWIRRKRQHKRDDW